MIDVDVPKDDLIAATAEILGDDVAALSLERLFYLITVTQHSTDVLLNEIERRGELTFVGGVPNVPYESDHMVQTVLTRPNL
ncbi:hypothetical protein JMJ56_31485 [Belnapia sp. T18]|uniref:Uncharacterized protein n=1 Tax=Belnapia arida TaxID=2804533 RepID=A0ABS1UCS5_9PROT|nr:hypothetical protein [Belnapia arida]MBL6082491.1 hypothetical protein [Belnapia arida]